ncbi:uncharacterized protein LOC133194031 [Saccostrea echinata]|uniref:uncharacterized protein LOC133194031 n=1 Tax=Saccostrea echinata TaxID=191078 RepID=UPI002A80EC9F|nr:uncharacterized protein LOC133194031 [Saccostrea echinata]
MSSNTSGQSIKFSVEFRDTVYRLNPDYLSCKHKVLFEVNATDTLRDQGSEIHFYHSTDFADGRKSLSDITKSESPSKTVSNIEEAFSDTAIRTFHSKYLSNDRKGLRGWEVCLRPHSAQSYHFRRQRSDHTRDLQRSRSLSAKINTTRREKLKVSKISIHSPGSCSSRPIHRDSIESTSKKDDRHTHSSSSSLMGGNYYCTPGYVTTIPKPISYKFKHFEYTDNYIEQYRNEYTYPRLVEPTKPPSSGSCNCEVKGQVNPGKQPVFRWVEPCLVKTCSRHQQEGHSSSGLTINSISTSSQGPDRSRQTPHHLLDHNGVLKTEFYNNPLVIDNTKLDRNKTSSLSRNRPCILSTVRPVIHPNSSVTLPVKRPTYQPQSNK